MATGYSIATKITAHDAASQVLRNVQASIDKTAHKVKKMHTTMQSAWTVAAGNMLAAGLQRGMRFVFDSVREVEDATAQFIPKFGGDIEKAKGFVDQLNKVAAATPFQFNDLAKVSDMLMGFGVATEKDVIPQMRIIGDLAGGNAQRFQSIALAYSQSMAAGKANMQDMNQLINAGVPILGQLAKMYKVNVGQIRDMISKGKIMSTDIQRAFKDMTSAGGKFYKGMEIASQTTSGKLSTLEDNMKRAAASMGGAAVRSLSPLINILSKLADGFSSMSGVAQSALIALAGAAAIAATSIKTKMAGVAMAISGVLSLWAAMDEKMAGDAKSLPGATERTLEMQNMAFQGKKIVESYKSRLENVSPGTKAYAELINEITTRNIPGFSRPGMTSEGRQSLTAESSKEQVRTAIESTLNKIHSTYSAGISDFQKKVEEARKGIRIRIANPVYGEESGLQAARDAALLMMQNLKVDINKMILSGTIKKTDYDSMFATFQDLQSRMLLTIQDADENNGKYAEEFTKTSRDLFNEFINSRKQDTLSVDINVNQDGRVVSTTATPGRAQGTRFNLQTRTNP